MKTKIGLLGGIGPEATGIFYLSLIEKMQKKGMIHSNADFPQIVINSIPAPELVGETINEEDLADYIEGLKELDIFGVDVIVMVCNTIHLYHAQLQSKIKTPIIDLRKEFAEFMKRSGEKAAVVLATPSTIESGLFEVEGVKYAKLSEAEEREVSEAIFRFNAGADRSVQSERVRKIAEKYSDQGRRLVVLGCTEISLMLKDSKIRNVDTMDILSDVLINKISSSR
ncbi:MAG: amino acid racemase [Candidatus Micrarchaeota archaeon]|nr:amino acid racemase [Candidatus Micrarchaeota archaeon]